MKQIEQEYDLGFSIEVIAIKHKVTIHEVIEILWVAKCTRNTTL